MTNDDLHSRRIYDVHHRTEYSYAEYVTASYGRACLRPRDTPHQQAYSSRIEIVPAAGTLTEHVDLFGNFSHYFEVRTRHTELKVHKSSTVQVEWPRVDVDGLNRWTVGSAVEELRRDDAIDRVTGSLYRLPSSLVEIAAPVRAYAEKVLVPRRPLGEALEALTHSIHDEIAYEQGATTVTTTLAEVLEARAGVCQDFAHLAAGCLRHVGFPARYVSGYLETSPPAGQPKLEGSDASHAWCSVVVPGGEWVDLDPTNDHFADSRYIVTAWGRDFRDVSPMKGVIFTESGSSTLHVAVDVVRRADHELPARAAAAGDSADGS
ncbi:transglutaminase family protein [Leekyejoonella antrihumi]|uniref:Transglutaminase family protein n=1 Tax=Leekyejoonella antrihumi TaxID=1660198 RepID=A0A563E5U6_9MICO|nr:transglutaminase family protein [Leekyejoonella antrihumi]TWP37224.1 transglutaminase family protein [Leekyejoonella antrihumi]